MNSNSKTTPKNHRVNLLIGFLAATVSASVPALAQNDVSDMEGYARYTSRAHSAAVGTGANLLHLCDIPEPRQPAAPSIRAAMEALHTFPVAPTRVFDNLYFVGTAPVSAWALQTSEGIILIDALNDEAEVRLVILPGFEALGLDPADVRYVIITHGHGDHYGGSSFFAQQYGARLIASDADWNYMKNLVANPIAEFTTPPSRDITVADGHELTLGDTTVTSYVTPGHSPGTLSLLFPVFDNGERHVAALWGGTGLGSNDDPRYIAVAANVVNKQLEYAFSAARFAGFAGMAGADVILSNHAFIDDANRKMDALPFRAIDDPHPFATGLADVQGFLQVAHDCAMARALANIR